MPARRGYRLTPLAEADLEDIWLYTLRTWSIEQADRYHSDIVEAFEALASGTKMGRRVDIREGYYKYPVGSHFIYYRIQERTIHVMRVLHQHMDVGRHL